MILITILFQRWTNYWLRVTAIESAHMSRQVRVMMKTKTLIKIVIKMIIMIITTR